MIQIRLNGRSLNSFLSARLTGLPCTRVSLYADSPRADSFVVGRDLVEDLERRVGVCCRHDVLLVR
jgi:hypothetical protein